MKQQFILILIITIPMCIGCSIPSDPRVPPTAPADSTLPNPIFPNSDLIDVRTPKLGDTVTSTPTFTWVVTGRKYVYLGIFSQNLVIKDGNIANINANIWAWHSGLGTGREGDVSFSGGVDVVNGELQTGRLPTALISGNSYVWAVWAWNDDGTEIKQSSKEMFFVVK